MLPEGEGKEYWEVRAKKVEKELKQLRKLTKEKTTILEQREKIDTRTNILRFSIGLNTGLIAGLMVHFFRNC
jgi:hypothetical protein